MTTLKGSVERGDSLFLGAIVFMKPEWEQAVRLGDTGGLSRLLTAGADINSRDQHGQTALMIAAHAGCRVTFLVGQGAALNHTAKHGLSAVMLADFPYGAICNVTVATLLTVAPR